MTRTFAKVTTSFRDTHKWSGCDIEEVKFLKNEHHHEFKVTVWIEQFHDNRDIEYICFQRWLDKVIKSLKLHENKSCEMLASALREKIKKKYKNREVKIEVNEDGYYGAYIEPNYNPDLLWLCGFIDGEGYIGIWQTKRKNNIAYAYSIQISGTHKKSIERCAKIFNKYISATNINVSKYKHPNNKWKTVYSIKFSRQADLIKLCDLIIPHLYVKKEQAMLLKKYLINRQKNNSKIKNNADNSYTKTDVDIYNKMKILNERGII